MRLKATKWQKIMRIQTNCKKKTDISVGYSCLKARAVIHYEYKKQQKVLENGCCPGVILTHLCLRSFDLGVTEFLHLDKKKYYLHQIWFGTIVGKCGKFLSKEYLFKRFVVPSQMLQEIRDKHLKIKFYN